MNILKQKMVSYNPASGQIVWSGEKSNESKIVEEVKQAKEKQIFWEELGLEHRKKVIKNFAHLMIDNSEEAAKIISEENGKPLWESKAEVNSLNNKVQAVFDAFDERAQTKIKEVNGRISVTRFRPHGVMAVLGPFNFPMSMPNSHIMPSLLAGNSIVFKPSERTPKSAEFYVDMWRKAGVPSGVLQVIHGDKEVGECLISQPEVNGVLFIGSRRAGVEIQKKLATSTKICALEMGGNSPLIIWDYNDVRAAIHITIQSAYISSGQRCSSARRIIINSAISNVFIQSLITAIKNIIIGNPFDSDPIPFMGPLIDSIAVEHFLSDYDELISHGAKILVPTGIVSELGNNFVKPALVDVTGIQSDDREIFGPLLQLSIVDTLEQAVIEANATQFGLAAGIVTNSIDNYRFFYKLTKAGIINWNQPLTGSTTVAPFGGVKASGNYRPAGYLSVDYCSYACASIEDNNQLIPATLPFGVNY